MGHKFAFGNTQEAGLGTIRGIKEMGRKGGEKFDHGTGKGYHKGKTGQYYDAIYVKKSKVYALMHECFGGIAPVSYQLLKSLARRANKVGRADGGAYDFSRTASSYLTHYKQLMSVNVVMHDAANINDCITRRSRMHAIGAG